MDNLISASSLLQRLSVDGKIDIVTVAAELQTMVNRQKLLEKHTHKIWLASDGYYKTKVRESDGKLRLIKKKDLSDLEDAVIEHIKGLSQKQTFKKSYEIWIERQKNCGRCGNTIVKYEADYRRFYAGYPLEDIDIQDIDDEILSKHIIQVLGEKEIRWRAFKDIMGCTNGVFEKAVRDKFIQDNPMKYLDIPIYRKYCYIAPVKTTNERVLTEDDTHTLIDKIRNPKAHNVNRMCCFAIELALYTGMRVGELAGLMWEDILLSDNVIVIRHSEKYDRKTKISTISTTKTGKERVFPLVDEIKDLLIRIRNYEEERGWQGEFVFQDAEGRLTKSKISDSTRNLTMSNDFTSIKSIHAIRRTFNSKLRCSGVSTTMASGLLGHTERVNELNYTYDLTGMSQKRAVISEIVTGVTKSKA